MTNLPPQYPICSFNNTPCRFCSNESTYCACTFIQKKDSHYIGVKVGYIKSERGQYCNNICDWVKNLKSCPKEDDLMKGEVLEEWEKKSMKKPSKKPVMVKKEKPVKKTVKKLVKKPIKKVTPRKQKKTVVKKPITKKKPSIKETPVVKKPKRKYTKKVVEKPKRKYVKKTPIVEEKPKRKYVKKISTTHKKKPVVKKVTPKQKKEIIYI